MTGTVRYLTHPQVQIDPSLDVRHWSLNTLGAARVAALCAQPGQLRATTRVISSTETKALETALPLARALGVTPELRHGMHENDRSATGYLPPPEFEQVADAFFAQPDTSIRGWETARAAQARILAEVNDCPCAADQGDVLFVGHGAVGTLLYCALAGLPIDRRHDQGPGGGGCWFAFDRTRRQPAGGWRPLEALLSADR
ncbi:histidine phosphatase family protein [Pseudotabrizicola algicola]|uniref:Histidine phosphatase family protein n=1 Tax=Pseudotabrizicola algicola TaxID=2709381 RepID=A0A6B3RQ28_9RHOB|nr:histidine phosphatase family protein [Pseudotabrizicola algicola]NEX45162.1 histidine phosphatase family protein [Pseudotabrizicola algicola]